MIGIDWVTGKLTRRTREVAGKLEARRRGGLGLDAVELRSATRWLGWLHDWHEEIERGEEVLTVSLHAAGGAGRRQRVVVVSVASSASREKRERVETKKKKKMREKRKKCGKEWVWAPFIEKGCMAQIKGEEMDG